MTGVVRELRDLEASGAIRVGPDVRDAPSWCSSGSGLSARTTPRPCSSDGSQLRIGDANLLFYYRKRLDGYGLRGAKPMLPQRSDA